MRKVDQDSAQVKFPPPILFLLCMGLALSMHILHPLPFLHSWMRWALGPVLILAGIFLIKTCLRIFDISETNVEPWKPTIKIVKRGPYAYSRNPIYFSFFLLGLGFTFLINDLWGFVFLIPFMLIIHFGVVLREERYLKQKFGQEYLDYQKSVRRWI